MAPNSSQVTTPEVSPKAAARPRSTPGTMPGRFPPRNYGHGSGLISLLPGSPIKQRGASPAGRDDRVRQTFSDFVPVGCLLIRLRIRATFSRRSGGRFFSTTNNHSPHQLCQLGRQSPTNEEIPRTFAPPCRCSESSAHGRASVQSRQARPNTV